MGEGGGWRSGVGGQEGEPVTVFVKSYTNKNYA